jgi:hypothetical protein
MALATLNPQTSNPATNLPPEALRRMLTIRHGGSKHCL